MQKCIHTPRKNSWAHKHIKKYKGAQYCISRNIEYIYMCTVYDYAAIDSDNHTHTKQFQSQEAHTQIILY